MRTIEQVKLEIVEIDRKLEEGVPADKAHVLRMDKVALEDELRELERVQEVAFPESEEAKPEPILATVDGLPLEVYTKSEDAAILIRCEVETVIESINKAHTVIVGGLNNKLHLSAELEAVLRQRNTELERDYEICAEENKELIEEIVKLTQEKQQITLERDEALKYRDNAAKQLEEMSFELEQNRVELNRNREVRALTEAERTAEQEAARQRFLDSRIKIYNPRNVDELNSRDRIANLAETGEEITYLAIYEKGGYNIITEEEALTIQQMNKPVEMPPLVNEVNEEETFQEDTSTEGTLPTHDTENQCEQREATEVEPEELTERRQLGDTEYRLATLEQQMKEVQRQVFGEVA